MPTPVMPIQLKRGAIQRPRRGAGPPPTILQKRGAGPPPTILQKRGADPAPRQHKRGADPAPRQHKRGAPPTILQKRGAGPAEHTRTMSAAKRDRDEKDSGPPTAKRLEIVEVVEVGGAAGGATVAKTTAVKATEVKATEATEVKATEVKAAKATEVKAAEVSKVGTRAWVSGPVRDENVFVCRGYRTSTSADFPSAACRNLHYPKDLGDIVSPDLGAFIIALMVCSARFRLICHRRRLRIWIRWDVADEVRFRTRVAKMLRETPLSDYPSLLPGTLPTSVVGRFHYSAALRQGPSGGAGRSGGNSVTVRTDVLNGSDVLTTSGTVADPATGILWLYFTHKTALPSRLALSPSP